MQRRMAFGVLVIVWVAVGSVASGQSTKRQDSATERSRIKPAPGPTPRELSDCVRLIGRHRYDDARALGRRLVKAYPESSRAHLLLALAYHKDRRYESAEPWFAKAMALDPKDHTAWSFYGWCLYNLGKADAARKMFDGFLRTQPEYADAHFALGLLDFEADKIESATMQFQSAIKFAQKAGSRGDEAKARARLADVYVRTGKLDAAQQELQKSVALNPDLYGAYYKLSRVLQRLGDAAGADRARRMHEQVKARVRPTRGHPE